MLAALAALRSGAGKLQVATVRSVAVAIATTIPEAFVQGLPETAGGAVAGAAAGSVAELAQGARAVLVGPGMSDHDECCGFVAELLRLLPATTTVVLDALALGWLEQDPGCLQRFGGRVVLTPNRTEAALLLGRDPTAVQADPEGTAVAVARRLGYLAREVVDEIPTVLTELEA